MTNVPPRWRKSSQSAAEADCVELSDDLGAVRDSKHPASVLTVDVRTFVTMLRDGRLDT